MTNKGLIIILLTFFIGVVGIVLLNSIAGDIENTSQLEMSSNTY